MGRTGPGEATTRRYLDLLTDALMVRQLHPWHANLKKRQEIDLLLRRGDRLLGVECKRVDAPRMTRSIRIALEDLGLERVAILYPGQRRYPLADRVEAVPVAQLATPGRLF